MIAFKLVGAPEVSDFERQMVEFTVRQYADLLLDMDDDQLFEHYQRQDVVWKDLETTARRSLFSWPSFLCSSVRLEAVKLA